MAHDKRVAWPRPRTCRKGASYSPPSDVIAPNQDSAATLINEKRDFETVIPGHGEPFKGKERIDYFQAFLRDLWQQAKTLHDEAT